MVMSTTTLAERCLNHILVTVVFDCDEDLWSMLKILARFNTFQVLASGDGVGDALRKRCHRLLKIFQNP